MYKTSLFWFVVATALLSLICVAGAVVFWDWLRPAVPYRVSNSETLRNVGLLVGGALAFVFALWRVLVAERQSGTAQRQANTAQQSLLHERYDRGAQMLGSSVLTVRLGGIYILARLASEHPAQYHVDVTRLFCVFVRLRENGNGVSCHPETDDEQDQQMPTLRADIQDVMQAIGSRSGAGIHFEQAEGFKLYLRDANVSYLQVQDANFSKAWLTNANLSHAVMPRANLSYARLRRANLSGTQLRNADLSEATLWGANLSGTILQNANLSGTDLCGVDARNIYNAPANGLTQAQLDTACAAPDNPPKLEGVRDAETGNPLIWCGKPYMTKQA